MTYIIRVLLSFWTVFCGYMLYNWFALPIGAPVLNYFHFYGLALLVELFTVSLSAALAAADSTTLQKVPEKYRSLVIHAARAVMATVSLGFGYVAHFFI